MQHSSSYLPLGSKETGGRAVERPKNTSAAAHNGLSIIVWRCYRSTRLGSEVSRVRSESQPSVCVCLFVCAWSHPTLRDPKDCSPPGSFIHEILQTRIQEWVAIFFLQGIFPTQGSNPHLLHWQADSLLLSCLGSTIQCLKWRQIKIRN